MKKRQKGSITVYLTMMILLVFSAFFAFMELSRSYGLKANVTACTEQAEDAVMASYHQDLWEQYHLLFYEVPELPSLERITELSNSVVEGNWTDHSLSGRNYYLLQVHLEEIRNPIYCLATDSGGAAFRKEAAQMMKATVAEDTLQTILKWAEGSDQNEEDAQQDALLALEDLKMHSGQKEQALIAEQAAQDASVQNGSESSENAGNELQLPEEVQVGNIQITKKDNPLEWVKTMQKHGVLSIVMPGKEISGKSITKADTIEKRSLNRGTDHDAPGLAATEEMLFRMYLSKYFGNVLEHPERKGLDYEMEYIIAGKPSDEANLKAVVNRMLLAREGVNMLFLETNPVKQEELTAMALAITSLLGIPEFEEVAKQGVMAAWAYAESLADVKILLDGGKIMPVKTEQYWHTDLFHLSESLGQISGATQQEGLSYANYLQLLMWPMQDHKLSLRAMDLMEQQLDVHMDQMLCSMKGIYVYQAQPLFWNFITVSKKLLGTYEFQEQGAFSYIT